jgi:two-component sensor histidine kinase
MEQRAQPWSLAGPSDIEAALESEIEASRQARRLIDRLGDVLPSSVLADLRTVITELVTNCVEHGSGNPIDVRIEVTEAGDVHGSVSDGGSAPISLLPATGVDDRGLGLRIVEALTSRWGTSPRSSDVWFELAAPRRDMAVTGA